MAQEYAIDTPYMRMVRDMEILREENQAEFVRGKEEGKEEGREEGSTFARRGDIIDILQARFGIDQEDSQIIAKQLLILTTAVLPQVLIEAATCPSKARFMQLLAGYQNKGT